MLQHCIDEHADEHVIRSTCRICHVLFIYLYLYTAVPVSVFHAHTLQFRGVASGPAKPIVTIQHVWLKMYTPFVLYGTQYELVRPYPDPPDWVLSLCNLHSIVILRRFFTFQRELVWGRPVAMRVW